jgi:hypothetical protein
MSNQPVEKHPERHDTPRRPVVANPEPVEAHPGQSGAHPAPVEEGHRSAGPPAGNPQPRAHGFYASALDPQELADLIAYGSDMTLDDEIGCARVALRRLLVLLDASDASRFDDPADVQPMTRADYARLMGLALQAARTIARLLRDKRALSDTAADGITGAIGTALDELSTLWGVPL